MADTDATDAKPVHKEERERQSAGEVFAELDRAQGRSGAEPETPARPSSAEPRLVGIVSTYPHLLHTAHPFFGPVLAGLRARLLAADCDMLIGSRSPSDEPGPDQFQVERWQRRGIDALVVLSITSHEDVAPLVRSGLPVVFVDFDAFGERTGYVMSDNLDGMAQAVRHLARLGRQRIATISGTLESRPGMDRLLGYRSELSRLGLEERHEYVVAGDFYHRSGCEACRRLLALPEPPDAIAAASDMMAVGAMLAIAEAGLRVPEDIAVTGFDDSDFAARLRPALTTVRQDALGARDGGCRRRRVHAGEPARSATDGAAAGAARRARVVRDRAPGTRLVVEQTGGREHGQTVGALTPGPLHSTPSPPIAGG